MVFSGIPFLFYFLPALLAAYYAVPHRHRETRNAVLLAASFLFYAWGEGEYLLLLLVSIGINHWCAHRLNGPHRAKWLCGGLVLNLLILSWFKYAAFVFDAFGLEHSITPHLPLGISFFTFQAVSYLIDIYRKDAKPPPYIRDTALYIASFPQLIAGPIVRFKSIATAIRGRHETVAQFADGTRLFILGLSQKVLLANVAAGPADAVFSLPAEQLTTAVAWAGLGAYSLQIFFDFAGYSNMAMGLGLMLGFSFPRNFEFPYTATSVTEFWRRWHMTLSQWFRDYLYIPLGGNRGGTGRTILNLWMVFLLCGLWHGAAWTFVLWGAWHGAFLSLERLGLGGALERVPHIVRRVYLLLAVMLGWVLFRAETLSDAGTFYAALAGRNGEGPPLQLIFEGSTGWVLMGAALVATPLPKILLETVGVRAPALVQDIIKPSVLVVALILCCAFLAGDAYNPFLYFRF